MTDTTTAAGSDTTTQKADDPTPTPEPTAEPEPQQPPKEGDTPTPEPEPAKPEAEPTEPDKAPEGAPKAYELQHPEGMQLELSLDDFETSARELNLTNEGAQSLLNTVLPKIEEAQREKLEASQVVWREDAAKDKEIGGDAFESNVAIAKSALKQFGSDKLTAMLVESGLGNHPEVLRVFYRVGKAISEDTILTGGTPSAGEDDLSDPKVQAARMYKENE